MVVILPGDLTAIVPNPVEVEYKPGLELAPIHHQHMVERTAVNWGQISLPENATTTAVQVTKHLLHSCILSRKRSKYIRSTCKRRKSNGMMVMFAVFKADAAVRTKRRRICFTALISYLNSYTCTVNSFLTDTPIRRTLL